MWHTYMVKSTYMWMDGQYDVVEVEIRMWFISKFESGSFVDPNFFLDEDLNTWLGSVALGSQLFQFLHHVAWIWAVGSFGGYRRAVTAGHRRGPGGD
jgi:hypothetical protein